VQEALREMVGAAKEALLALSVGRARCAELAGGGGDRRPEGQA